ncbi:hypothetical protein BAU16_01900 [Enterococcus sp. JM9B]|nr:hypothetical protein BAU16_01900 [Enterococcus sp. JM9B]
MTVVKKPQQSEAKKQRTNLVIKGLIVLMFLTGIGVFSYPFFVDSLNNYIDQKMVEKHQREAAAENQKNREQALEKMAAENTKRQEANSIAGIGLMEELFDTTEFNGNYSADYYERHLLGALYIPKIRASLPIFNETNQALLEKGTTLLQGTSYPIGGDNTHSVITGHTGIPEKMIFTDLEKLEKGDQFYIDVLGERLAYEVDEIQVVLPDNIEVLAIQEDRDLVTLLTCTPYMVNSHRLLVTGFRIPYEEKMGAVITQTRRFQFWRLAVLSAAAVAVLSLFSYWLWRKAVLFQASKRTYTLRFFVEEKSPRRFQLLSKNGTPFLRKDEPIFATAMEKNEVVFSEIPGGIYWVVAEGEAAPKLKAKIWQVRDREFRLSSRKKRVRVVKSREKQTVLFDGGMV